LAAKPNASDDYSVLTLDGGIPDLSRHVRQAYEGVKVKNGEKWRRDRDSNPGYARAHNGFRDRKLVLFSGEALYVIVPITN